MFYPELSIPIPAIAIFGYKHGVILGWLGERYQPPKSGINHQIGTLTILHEELVAISQQYPELLKDENGVWALHDKLYRHCLCVGFYDKDVTESSPVSNNLKALQLKFF